MLNLAIIIWMGLVIFNAISLLNSQAFACFFAQFFDRLADQLARMGQTLKHNKLKINIQILVTRIEEIHVAH
jgi:hypothetical protein